MDVHSGRHRRVRVPRHHPLGAVVHVPAHTHKMVDEDKDSRFIFDFILFLFRPAVHTITHAPEIFSFFKSREDLKTIKK